MPRTRDEDAFQAKRKDILRAAETLFIEQGFHQTGMAAICEAAGMSPGALYRYFPSKADFIQAFIEEEQAETATLFSTLKEAPDFRQAMVSLMVDLMEEVSDEDYGRLALEIAAEGERDEKIGPILAAAEQEALDGLAEVIADAQERGDVADSVDAKTSARLLLMIVDGATGTSLKPVPRRRLKPVVARMVDGLLAAA